MPIRPVTRSPLLLLTISICLALPVLVISSHILSVFRDEHASNPWWLPIWHAHFDTRGLVAITATSCVIFALDLVSVGLVVARDKSGGKSKIIKCVLAALMLVMAVCALIAIIISAVANNTSPSKSDTIQTWTCRWKTAVGAPENFAALCQQSQFTSYTSIPLFVIHLLLLMQSIQDVVAATQPPEPILDQEFVVITKSV